MSLDVRTVTALLLVYDMRRAVAFYRDALGFEVINSADFKSQPYWAMLKLGEAVVMLNAEYEDDERPPVEPKRPQHRGVTLYFGCRSADDVYEYLRAKGCDVSPPNTTGYGMRQVSLRDPDGFELCFQHAVPPDVQTSQ
jgi:glyoxylase I family protein